MNTNSEPRDFADYMPHRDALRRLVRGIVQDDHDSEDLVQEAALVVLQRNRDEATANPGWLRGVAKHLAWRHLRTENRRRNRETKAAQAGTTNDVTARVEMLQGVLDALLKLPKGQREVVSLRYLEGVPPRKIAKRLGQPVETVKTRLKRGLKNLRQSLDQQYDGNRGAWLALLIPFTPSSVVAGTAAATGTWLKGNAAAVLLVSAATIGGWYISSTPNTASRPDVGHKRVASQSSHLATQDDLSARSPAPPLKSVPFNSAMDVPAEQASESPAATAPKLRSGPTATGTIRARVVFRSGRPAAGARLIVANDETRRQQDCNSKGEAQFEITKTQPSFTPANVQVIWHGHSVRLTQGIPRYFDPVRLSDTWEIVLPDPALVTGMMVDESGKPVSGMGLSLASSRSHGTASGTFYSASVHSEPSGRFALEVPFEGPLQLLIAPKLSPTTDARGLARTVDMTTRPADGELKDMGVIPVALHPGGMWAAGSPQWLSLSSGETADLGKIRVARHGLLQIALTHGLTGAAVPGRWLQVLCTTRQVNLLVGPTDEQGRASLPFPPGTHRLSVRVTGEGFVAPTAPFTVRPGRSSLHELQLFDRSEDMTSKSRLVALRVTKENGEPLAYAHVSWSDQTGLTSDQGLLSLRCSEGESGPLEIRHAKHITKRVPNFQPPQSENEVSVSLQAAPTTKLRVTDSQGVLLKSIRLTPMSKSPLLYGLPYSSRLRNHETTHSISFRDEKAQFDTIVIRGADHGIAEIPLDSLLRTPGIFEVTLRDTLSIDVVVEDELGRPISGAIIWSGSRSLPIDLRRKERLSSEQDGRWFEDRATSNAAGLARLRIPAEGGVVCGLSSPLELSKSHGGIAALTESHGPLRLVLQGPSHLILNRGGPSPVDQHIHAVLKHPALRLWHRLPWPAEAASVRMLAPIRGVWDLHVAQQIDAQRRWRGKSFGGLLDATMGFASRDF